MNTSLPEHGFLNLNKLAGCTSRDTVDVVQKLARPAKVGHAGTLDPLATGVLVVAVGAATRLIEHVQSHSKSYVATFLLGRSSPSEDIECEVTVEPDPRRPTLAELRDVLPRFLGTIWQTPPAFSALKVDGKRAYDLARRGKTVALDARPIEIHDLAILEYDYPMLKLRIECGSGTYVRSLGRDLAAAVGTASVMSELVRTAVGPFRLEDSISPAQLVDDRAGGRWRKWLKPLVLATAGLRQVELTEDETRRIRHGQAVDDRWGLCETANAALAKDLQASEVEEQVGDGITPQRWVGLDAQGQLVAILVPTVERRIRATLNFPS